MIRTCTYLLVVEPLWPRLYLLHGVADKPAQQSQEAATAGLKVNSCCLLALHDRGLDFWCRSLHNFSSYEVYILGPVMVPRLQRKTQRV